MPHHWWRGYWSKFWLFTFGRWHPNILNSLTVSSFSVQAPCHHQCLREVIIRSQILCITVCLLRLQKNVNCKRFWDPIYASACPSIHMFYIPFLIWLWLTKISIHMAIQGNVAMEVAPHDVLCNHCKLVQIAGQMCRFKSENLLQQLDSIAWFRCTSSILAF